MDARTRFVDGTSPQDRLRVAPTPSDGTALRALRIELGLDVAAAARALRLTVGQVVAVETGRASFVHAGAMLAAEDRLRGSKRGRNPRGRVVRGFP